MDLLRFNADDIHELRIEIAENKKKMSKEEADNDFKKCVDAMRRAIREGIGSTFNPTGSKHV